MKAFVVSRVKVKDPEKMKEYGAKAGPTVAAHGGEVTLRGRFDAALLSSGETHATGIMSFPDLDAAKGWFNSDEYQALSDLRTAAGDMEFYLYEAL